MENKKSKNRKTEYFGAGVALLGSALTFWLCDIGLIPALGLASAAICMFAAGMNEANKKPNDEGNSANGNH